MWSLLKNLWGDGLVLGFEMSLCRWPCCGIKVDASLQCGMMMRGVFVLPHYVFKDKKSDNFVTQSWRFNNPKHFSWKRKCSALSLMETEEEELFDLYPVYKLLPGFISAVHEQQQQFVWDKSVLQKEKPQFFWSFLLWWVKWHFHKVAFFSPVPLWCSESLWSRVQRVRGEAQLGICQDWSSSTLHFGCKTNQVGQQAQEKKVQLCSWRFASL